MDTNNTLSNNIQNSEPNINVKEIYNNDECNKEIRNK